MDKQNPNSKSLRRAETNLQSKLSSTFLKKYAHNLVPGYNINRLICTDEWEVENVAKLYQEFPYHCHLPQPLLPPAKLSRRILEGEDPALQLLSVKECIQHEINRNLEYQRPHIKNFKKFSAKDIIWSEGEPITLPRYIARIAQLIDNDPDPYFSGNYNWYYTGGCLENVQLNGNNILIFPYAQELVCTPLKCNKMLQWEPIFSQATKHTIDDVIYELKNNTVHHTCRILTRRRNSCNISSLSEDDGELILKDINEEKSEVPFVSADLDFDNSNIYCTLDVEKLLKVWDVNRRQPIFQKTLMLKPTSHDSWANVKFHQSDPNLIFMIDRNSLHYIDTRTHSERVELTLNPKSYLEECESISLHLFSRHPACSYLGTYHHFLMCDDRSPGQCVQQKWTHQFKSAPLLGCTIDCNEQEFIVISSQRASENAIILNTWMNEDGSHSFHLPLTPPNIMETLYQSQNKGLCLDPLTKYRLNLSNVGSTLISNTEGDIFLFIQNSIGDIFYQCIKSESSSDEFVDTESCNTLDIWEKAFRRQNQTILPLNISGKVDMTLIYQNLVNKKLNPKSDGCNDNKLDYDPSWRQSLAKLESYVDILAPELLAVWEMVEETTTTPVSKPMMPHQKVLNWLETASTTNETMPLSQTESESANQSIINSQELISVSQQYVEENYLSQESFLPKVRTSSRRRKKKMSNKKM